MSILGIIPARFASTRFPGKPLAMIKGKSMLQRVYEQSKQSKTLTEVIIATEDQRIVDHAKEFGAKALLTSVHHPSGTDRCYEAYQIYNKVFDYVLNIQGDEPFLDPSQIDNITSVCDGEVQIATQMTLCTSHDILIDRGEVKIVLNNDNEAMYFSREPIPHLKNVNVKDWYKHFKYYRHVGTYVYRTDVLEQISKLTVSSLETAESLEQLRWLQNGFKIKCVETNYDSHAVDTPEDIEKVIRLMNIN